MSDFFAFRLQSLARLAARAGSCKETDHNVEALERWRDDICEQVRQYEKAGVTTMAALLFTEPTVGETLETMEVFAQQVIPNFR